MNGHIAVAKYLLLHIPQFYFSLQIAIKMYPYRNIPQNRQFKPSSADSIFNESKSDAVKINFDGVVLYAGHPKIHSSIPLSRITAVVLKNNWLFCLT